MILLNNNGLYSCRNLNSGTELSDTLSESSKQPQGKRTRTGRVFTRDATQILCEIFNHNRHPSSNEIRYLSYKLNVSEKSISTWFKNKRTKFTKSAKSPQCSTIAHVRLSYHLESASMKSDHVFHNLGSDSSLQQLADTTEHTSRNASRLQFPTVPQQLHQIFLSSKDSSVSRKRKHSCSRTNEEPSAPQAKKKV